MPSLASSPMPCATHKLHPFRPHPRPFWRCGLLLAVLAALLCLGACDRYTGVRGVVSDTAGAPIPGATVRLSASNMARVCAHPSDSHGAFDVGFTHGLFPGAFTLSAEKPGYRHFAASIQPGVRTVNVVLAQNRPSTGSPAAPGLAASHR